MTDAKAANPGPRYHHGALKSALLEAAETILKRDGIEGLTLRAAAREVGVSHAAPKNHFDDVRGLLSELAAVGYVRFRAALLAEIAARPPALSPIDAAGIGYVKFAKDNPELFTLMFRSERLDFTRPALRDANRASFAVLAETAAGRPSGGGPDAGLLSIAEAAQVVTRWSLVHGYACLMLDNRLKPLLAATAGQPDEMSLITAIITGPSPPPSP